VVGTAVVVAFAGVVVTVGVVVVDGDDVQPVLRITIIITDKTNTIRKEVFKVFMKTNRKCDPI